MGVQIFRGGGFQISRDRSRLLSLEVVSCLDPTPKRRKGSGTHRALLGRTGCSMSCDRHDNASYRHGNASSALTCSNRRQACGVT